MARRDAPGGELNGFLDSGSHIKGELHFDDTFRVDGKITGKASSSGDLVIGEGGLVDGETEVGRLFVSGTVKGSVVASNRVEISPGGKVYAEISTPSLVIHDGAFFQGQCAMENAGKAARAPASSTPKKPTKDS